MLRTITMATVLAAACTPAPDYEREATVATRIDNHIDNVEFSAEDLAVVKRFYGDVFGWSFQDWGPDYVSFSGAGVEGGFRGGEAPQPGGALVILYAGDLAAAEQRIVAGGGTILERHEFPGGRRFHFRDPAGNVLAVWSDAAQ